MEKFSFSTVKTAVKEAVEVLKLNKDAMHKIALDEKATLMAFAILLAPFVVNTLLGTFQGTMFFGLQMKVFLIPVLVTVGGIFLMSLAAQLIFQARGDHMAFFRVLGFASIIGVVSVVAVLLSVLGISSAYNLFSVVYYLVWIGVLVVSYSLLMSYYKLNQQNAIITVVIGIVAMYLLQNILGTIFIGRYYELMYL